MNREYAYNRDKGKCKCCGRFFSNTVIGHCHHVDNKLPLERINKVQNLAWVCVDCHHIPLILTMYVPGLVADLSPSNIS